MRLTRLRDYLAHVNGLAAAGFARYWPGGTPGMPSLTGRVVLHNDLLATAERRAVECGTGDRACWPVMFAMGIEGILLVCRDL